MSSVMQDANAATLPRADEEIRFAIGESFLGLVLIASSDTGICAILPGDDPAVLLSDLRERFPRARLIESEAALTNVAGRVLRFIEAPGASLDFPLDLRGTDFQRNVWQMLREIPVGTTASYTDIARRIGSPGAVRAVAAACAANALAVAVPCHRVVRKNGALSGYRWGVERKRRLLAQEVKAA